MTGAYDREWTDAVEAGKTRMRYGLTTERGTPVLFLVQLEYRPQGERNGEVRSSAEWRVVARFDHDGSGPEYRDVDLVGLHMDVYGPDGAQRRKKDDFPPVELEQAMKRAEQYLMREHDRLVERFERWT